MEEFLLNTAYCLQQCLSLVQWNVIPHCQNKEQNVFLMNTKINMLLAERDAAIKERDRALSEKRVAFDERDAAIQK